MAKSEKIRLHITLFPITIDLTLLSHVGGGGLGSPCILICQVKGSEDFLSVLILNANLDSLQSNIF